VRRRLEQDINIVGRRREGRRERLLLLRRRIGEREPHGKSASGHGGKFGVGGLAAAVGRREGEWDPRGGGSPLAGGYPCFAEQKTILFIY